MGSVHCEVVFSMFLLHLSSKKEMHFISSAWHGLLCHYFRNNLGICQSQLPNLQCQASLPINKAEALKRQLQTNYFPSRQAIRVHYISTWIYRGLLWSSRPRPSTELFHKNARFLGAFCPSVRSRPESCSKVSSYKFYDKFGTHLFMTCEKNPAPKLSQYSMQLYWATAVNIIPSTYQSWHVVDTFMHHNCA